MKEFFDDYGTHAIAKQGTGTKFAANANAVIGTNTGIITTDGATRLRHTAQGASFC